MEQELISAERFQVSGSLDAAVETDLPPEYCRYTDMGCNVATAYLGHQSLCAECPFSECIFEEPGGRQHLLKELRNEEIIKKFKTEGRSIKELAVSFNVSIRTIQRVLKRVGNE